MLTLVVLFLAFATVHSHDDSGCHATEGGNGGGSCCGHPFIYQGKSYSQCIDLGFHAFWCPTTGNYDSDKKWGLCKFGDSGCMATSGGNSGGAACVFPFNYRGQQITSCTKERHDKLWCATTNDYDKDGKWGDCVPEKTACACRPCQNGGACTNEGSGYKCLCTGGFMGKNCEVKDLCASTKPCKNGATCSNTDTSYSCQCAAGFTGTNCDSDVNECLSDNGGCSAQATCTNTDGGRTCSCNSGYQGNGETCSDVNECQSDNGGCSAKAVCTNTVGGRKCSCNSGYEGNGETCSDVNECARNNGGCRNGGRCINTAGASYCQCSNKYTGRFCERVNPNELVWYCAVKIHGGVRARTTDLRQAQRSLGHGNQRNRQGIIPMKGRQTGDPHHLAKSWGGGSMWWLGWDDINNMRNQCRNQPIPVGK